MYPITRFAVDTLRPEYVVQPIHANYLTTIGFIKGKTLWYRKTSLQPVTYRDLCEIPSRGKAAEEAEGLLAKMEKGEASFPFTAPTPMEISDDKILPDFRPVLDAD